MAINKTLRMLLKALSYGGIEVHASRRLANLKSLDPMKFFYKKIDYQIYNGDYEIPVRIYPPGDKMVYGDHHLHVLLFLHGGGWILSLIHI